MLIRRRRHTTVISGASSDTRGSLEFAITALVLLVVGIGVVGAFQLGAADASEKSRFSVGFDALKFELADEPRRAESAGPQLAVKDGDGNVVLNPTGHDFEGATEFCSSHTIGKGTGTACSSNKTDAVSVDMIWNAVEGRGSVLVVDWRGRLDMAVVTLVDGTEAEFRSDDNGYTIVMVGDEIPASISVVAKDGEILNSAQPASQFDAMLTEADKAAAEGSGH